MRFCSQLLAVLICLQFACALALDLDTVSPIKLQEITRRGKLLAEYDRAAAHGTDAVLGSYPEVSKKHSFHQFLANSTPSGWTVSFGTLSSEGGSFEVFFDAIEDRSTGKYKVVNYATPRKDTGVLLNEARAVKSCLAVFSPNGKTNNYAILPAGAEQMYVYIYPAQTVPNIYPLGGDMRYLVSADGNKIVESRRMHQSILENPPPPAGQSPVMGYHTAVVADVPEDTDVFHVLVRKPSIPEMIATERFAYRIEQDGSIKYLGTVEEVLKKPGKQKN